ncbi:MAG TPA: UDP-3-O-acyl-N-acetylglucosamine deacetylase [Lacipirellulaceae bacterium]|nr:UDP-3-O-acyl-N-acetylglucosamine deacetylase [Lacipirellulaceae bacterium]
MNLGSPQNTIVGRASVTGFGYWSGQDVRIEFRPAPAGAGITFVRADLGAGARIPATVDYQVDSPRRTNLRCGSASVEMVEHVLAALAGLEVDNCEVWTDRPEMPGCDGSAAPFVDALLRARVVPQGSPAAVMRITEPVRVSAGDAWIEAHPAEDDQLSLEFQLDFSRAPAIGRQVARTRLTPTSFRRELASCRTFLLETEAAQLVSQGLGLRVTSRDLLVFNEQGPIDNRLRFPNECARHKALDVLGDLALAGCRMAGRIVACRSGHRLHAELTRKLVERFSAAPLRATA